MSARWRDRVRALMPPSRRPRPAGDGVWGRLDGRFVRAEQQVARVTRDADDGVRAQARRLSEVATQARRLCRMAQAAAPSSDDQVPNRQNGLYVDAHRMLSQAATSAAQAAQAAVHAQLGQARRPEAGASAKVDPDAPAEAVRRAVDAMEARVGRAGELLTGGTAD